MSAPSASVDRLLFAAPYASSPGVIDDIPTCPIDFPRRFFSALSGCRLMIAMHVSARLRTLIFRLIGTRIDDEQHLAFLDHGAVDKVDR